MRSVLFSLITLIGISCSVPEAKKIEKIEAKYENGNPHKVRIYTVQNADTIPQMFKEFYPDGKIKTQGAFDVDSNREGKWEAFYEDGKPWSIGFYKKGKSEGKRTVWYASGKKRFEGMYKNGNPTGEWVFWDQSGNEIERKVYN